MPVLIVRGLCGKSRVLALEDGESVGDLSVASLRCRLEIHQGVPAHLQRLTCHGRRLLDDPVAALTTRLSDLGINESETVVHVSVRGAGLLGGKGGFGAQLRLLAKQASKNRTTDFGACRDLAGRRLRHVNDEKILQQWKDAQDRGEKYDPSSTSSGIDNWFLPLPAWAEGGSAGGRKNGMVSRRKTALCKDWLRCREERPPPADAPPWYGCPRGRACPFAHGDAELRGDAAVVAAEHHKEAARREQEEARDQYLGVMVNAARGDDEVANIVAQGLQAAKRARREENLTVGGQACDTKKIVDDSTNSAVRILQALPLVAINGHAVMVPSTGEVEGSSDFCTAVVNVAVPIRALETDAWYYEVELLTAGVIQLGWARVGFSFQAEGSGVGDDGCSWSYDGSRGAIFHGENDENATQFGATAGPWKAGDVVGCMLVIGRERMKLSYAINGTSLGCAFDSSVPADALFFPAFSLEDGEAVLVNAGQNAFRFSESFSSTGLQVRPLWEAVQFYPATKPLVLAESAKTVKISEAKAAPCVSVVDGHVDAAAAAAAAAASIPVASAESGESFEPISLEDDKWSSAVSLESLGLARLKAELQKRELKIGGTLQERAARLWSVRGLSRGQYDKKLVAKGSK